MGCLVTSVVQMSGCIVFTVPIHNIYHHQGRTQNSTGWDGILCLLSVIFVGLYVCSDIFKQLLSWAEQLFVLILHIAPNIAHCGVEYVCSVFSKRKDQEPHQKSMCIRSFQMLTLKSSWPIVFLLVFLVVPKAQWWLLFAEERGAYDINLVAQTIEGICFSQGLVVKVLTIAKHFKFWWRTPWLRSRSWLITTRKCLWRVEKLTQNSIFYFLGRYTHQEQHRTTLNIFTSHKFVNNEAGDDTYPMALSLRMASLPFYSG